MADRSGVPALWGSFVTAAACIAVATRFSPWDASRPWSPGEPLPIWRRWFPADGVRVEEAVPGQLELTAPVLPDPPPAPEPDAPPTVLPSRPPGVATALVDPGFRGLDAFYRALATEKDKVRALHFGDSLLAADGVSGELRARLQARWGDGGPGWLSVGMDPAWNVRTDVSTSRSSGWTTYTLLDGGARDGRYGLGGIVTTGVPRATFTVWTPRRTWRERVPMERWEVFSAPDAAFHVTTDVPSEVTGPSGRSPGFTRLTVTTDATATLWGVAIEHDHPGLVWDTLGVVGIGSASIQRQDAEHLASQVSARKPALIVVELGGNEIGYDPVRADDPAGYTTWYADAMRRLRAGAPDASCLVVGPLDQGVPGSDPPKSRKGVSIIAGAQRAFAADQGCAYWDGRAAMGGPGAITRWSQRNPPLAWTDLVHLSMPGQKLLGDLLADALLADHDAWEAAGGLARSLPERPGDP
jgi:lysophospholipase L1-like esterase